MKRKKIIMDIYSNKLFIISKDLLVENMKSPLFIKHLIISKIHIEIIEINSESFIEISRFNI